ncbi:hypothetical protein AGMMS50230_08680 [Spirochaetia bacterium]|nr:hypothetical protein AGMMS50230_08680 [Spirochaetia bacterium]
MEEGSEQNVEKPFFKGLQSTYFHFFKDAGTAMAIADKSGILVAGNDSFSRLIAYLSGTPVDIKSNNARLGSSIDFLPIHDTVRFSNLLSKLINNDNTDHMDFKTPYRDKFNNVHWFKIYAWKMSHDPRVDLSGRGPFVGFIMNDETVEIEAEEKLQEDMRIAEKTMEAKSRFLAVMSHEIRTPIQTIIGMTELLESTLLAKNQDEYTRQIKFSTEVLLSLVNDILDYSKIEAGKMELERIPFSPAKTILQAAEMLSLETGKKGLEVTLDLDSASQEPMLGDAGKFRQVVINLVKNAVKFTPQGSITISAAVSPGADSRNRTISVSVADTGIGISEEARERLFTTFMQADSSHTRRFGGTGLGLAISRSMVELMGGTIEMVPNHNGGSVFRFTIPAEEAPVPTGTEAEAAEKAAAEKAAAEKPPAADFIVPAEDLILSAGAEKVPAEKMKVLIVEDHPVNRRLFELIMEKLSTKTESAGDGVEALEKAAANPPDLIFMDIQMPRMNGYEAAAELRKSGFKRPLIAVTAGVLADEQQQCREAGFDDILLKPFKQPDIAAMYHKWAGKAGLGMDAASPAAVNAALTPGPARIFSKEDLLDTFMNNSDLAKSLLDRFVQRSAGQLESFPDLLAGEKWEEAYRLAHTIKGTAMTMSGTELGYAAAILEKAAKQKDRKKAEAALPAVLEAFDRFKKEAGAYIHGTNQ